MRFTAETRGCLKCKISRPFLDEGVDVLTDVPRTDDFLRTQISWIHRLPNFLTYGAPLRALRARESHAKNSQVKNSHQSFYKLLPV